ncbi:tellurium resistance protein TerY [Spirochaetia bacterium]|nr:tellurium resistance protein TerY [Spirochaetia bacterium]GHU31954.1 tellurium resistance protein TerY [Spirochaetia bacterium]
MPMEPGEIVRRQLVLFFLIDTSGSMAGDKIDAVNAVMREIMPELDKLSSKEDNAASDIEVAVLEFNNSAEWKTTKPIPVKSYQWSNLSATGGTNLEDACRKLATEMQRGRFLRDHNLFAPIMILMSDGQPNGGYKEGLAELKKNPFYANKDSKGGYKEKSIKVACAIGPDADTDVLAEFTENKELVFEAKTIPALKNWIKFIAVQTTVADIAGGGPESLTEKLEEFKAQEDKVTVGSAEDYM